MKENAGKLLNRELKNAVDKYLNAKNKTSFVKNLDTDQRFRKLKVWEESDQE